MVIGVSGGLDSTHALIVAAKVCDRLGLPRTDMLGFTMPGFATSEGTKANAWALMRALGRRRRGDRHPPGGAADAGRHGPPVRRRASRSTTSPSRTCRRACAPTICSASPTSGGGFVIGTGDLSELALGWCTYGVGDQMSHYNVNAGVPKTLIQYLIRWATRTDQFDPATDAVLEAILATEISPELVPAEAGQPIQSTEAKIGPYELHDFFLFHTMRYGLPPSKVAFLAWHAWRDAEQGHWPMGFPEAARRQYDLATIRSWLEVFLWRFFAFSQFKRSALPNGPKVSAGGALSPRGDWRAPSDATAEVWLEELRRNVPEA